MYKSGFENTIVVARDEQTTEREREREKKECPNSLSISVEVFN